MAFNRRHHNAGEHSPLLWPRSGQSKPRGRCSNPERCGGAPLAFGMPPPNLFKCLHRRLHTAGRYSQGAANSLRSFPCLGREQLRHFILLSVKPIGSERALLAVQPKQCTTTPPGRCIACARQNNLSVTRFTQTRLGSERCELSCHVITPSAKGCDLREACLLSVDWLAIRACSLACCAPTGRYSQGLARRACLGRAVARPTQVETLFTGRHGLVWRSVQNTGQRSLGTTPPADRRYKAEQGLALACLDGW